MSKAKSFIQGFLGCLLIIIGIVLIIGVIAACLSFGLIKTIGIALIVLLGIFLLILALIVAFAVYLIPGVIVSMITEKLGLNNRLFLSIETLIFGASIVYFSFVNVPQLTNFNSLSLLKYLIPFSFFVFALYETRKLTIIKNNIRVKCHFDKKEQDSYNWIAYSLFSVIFYIVLCIYLQEKQLYKYNQWFDYANLILSSLLGIISFTELDEIYKVYTKIKEQMNFEKFIKVSEIVGIIIDGKKEDFTEKNKYIEDIQKGCIAKYIEDKRIIDVQVKDDVYLYKTNFYDQQLSNIKNIIIEKKEISKDKLSILVKEMFYIDDKSIELFVQNCLDFGCFLELKDQENFVSNEHYYQFNICYHCGIGERVPEGEEPAEGEWYCSNVCRNADELCRRITEKSHDEFLKEVKNTGFIMPDFSKKWNEDTKKRDTEQLANDSVNLGYVIPKGGEEWSRRHKFFAAGGQGHGYIAEDANTAIDRMHGHEAKVVGNDYAKNGADRIVDGIEIQTKYCKSPVSSVNQAFGSDSNYRYYTSSGQPMQLEVPRDQYDKAVEVMKGKIKEGNVPGVSDPEDAYKIVRKGRLTYQQAVNMTKFGTWESLAYDIGNGAVIGAYAGGISFCLNAFIYFLNTEDIKEAFRAAGVAAGKTFVTTLSVYVTASQLQKIEAVQSALSHIDVNSIRSSYFLDFLERGLNVNAGSKAAAVNEVNKRLRGQIVTSVALIVVTTGPDFYKFINGYMSNKEFCRNLTKNVGVTAGGTVGAVVGTALIPIPIVGGLIGGMIGGAIAATTAEHINEKVFGQKDAEKVLLIVNKHFEFLCVQFSLNNSEVKAFSENLQKIITQKWLEEVFSAQNRRSFVSLYLKPVVVSIVKLRPVLVYEAKDVVDMLAE